MAKKTRSGGGGAGREGERPRIKTSHHGKPAAGPAAPPRKRATRAAPRPTTAASAAAGLKAALGPRTRKAKAGPIDTGAVASDEARRLAIEIAVAALEKKAVGLEILDVSGKVDYADFLVLMTGRSDRQVSALAQAIEEALGKRGRRPLSVEGMPNASWVLMDFGDVVVHVFQEEARNLYDLEGLWLDARRIPVPGEEVT